MQDWLGARAQASPDKIAIIEHFNDGTTSTIAYKHLHRRVDQFCHQLHDAGVKEGQHVAMLMMNSTLAVVPFFAAMRMGLVFVPLNIRLTLDELDFQIQQADVDWVLPYGTSDQLAGLRDKGHQIVVFPRKQKPSKTPYPQREFNLDDPLLIVHTSGTSGKPKGAMLSYGNVFHSAMASAYRIGHQPNDIWLCVLPLYHIGGLSVFIRAVLYGITVDLHENFNAEAINQALTNEPITLISLVPTMLYRLLEIRQSDWHSALRLVLLGGAATSPELMQTCIVNQIPVATTYGLSEAASQVATTLSGDAVRKAGTVGKPLLFTQIKIIDDEGNNQATGDYGEILVKGLTVMQGYYNNPQATAKTIQDGWLHTGDIGYLDADGDLFLVQRRSDLIVTGGENVYPAEVEAVLRQITEIAHVAVVGIDDVEWGQKVASAIVIADNATLAEDTISDFARQHLAGYKVPRVIRFVDALPLTGSGKIQRRAVQALFEE